ncbi:MAG: hypothetical protein J6C04_08775, partial [Oscillospiraceae bacterium]|nr:hypothetical protein [Oscillospiraceae bacterium]
LLEDSDATGRKPFDHFTPKYSWLKHFSLVGLHFMYKIKLDPAKLKIFGPISEWAGRIYGHISKSYVSKEMDAEFRAKIDRFVK